MTLQRFAITVWILRWWDTKNPRPQLFPNKRHSGIFNIVQIILIRRRRALWRNAKASFFKWWPVFVVTLGTFNHSLTVKLPWRKIPNSRHRYHGNHYRKVHDRHLVRGAMSILSLHWLVFLQIAVETQSNVFILVLYNCTRKTFLWYLTFSLFM